jgi:hypothetical protein
MPELESLAVKPKLSTLIIDTNKDWASYVIKNLGSPVDANDAIRKTDLDSHRTASTIDHPDGSVTFSKLDFMSKFLIFVGL